MFVLPSGSIPHWHLAVADRQQDRPVACGCYAGRRQKRPPRMVRATSADRQPCRTRTRLDFSRIVFSPPMSQIFDLDMIKAVYSRFPARIAAARKAWMEERYGKPPAGR